MKTINKIVYITAVCGIIFTSCNNAEVTVNTTLETPVSVMELKEDSISSFINTSGTVIPLKEATLMSELEGKYQLQINKTTGKPYALGDIVKKDEVIIKLENTEYENSIKIKSVRLDLEISKQEYEKQQSLYDKGGVTFRELKNAEIAYINTEYSYQSAIIQQEKMSIKAPFSGTIVTLPYFTPNGKVANGTELLSMMDFSELYMEVNLPEKNMSTLRPGMSVNILNNTMANDTLQGILTEISPAISIETRTFTGVVKIPNKALILKPGMFVKADIETEKHANTIVIPKEIIRGRGNSQYVFVVDKNIAYQRRITTGLESTYTTEVTSGISSGERLIIKGYETLRNKATVKVIQ